MAKHYNGDKFDQTDNQGLLPLIPNLAIPALTPFLHDYSDLSERLPAALNTP
ncbi:hypothetical protein CCP3SC1_290014 [Gammaproteobacteria bacterium]